MISKFHVHIGFGAKARRLAGRVFHFLNLTLEALLWPKGPKIGSRRMPKLYKIWNIELPSLHCDQCRL